MSQKNIKTTMNCGNRKIKINDITLKDNNGNCDLDKYRNIIKETCDDKHSCTITNKMFDCPGFEFGGMTYACVDTESTDSSNGVNISQSMEIDLGDIIESGNDEENISYDASVTKMIQQSVANRLQNMNYQGITTNLNDVNNNQTEEIQGIEAFSSLPNTITSFNIHNKTEKSWIYLCALLILILLAMVIVIFYRKSS